MTIRLFLSAVLLLAGFTLMTEARDKARTIEHPLYCVSNTTTIDIERIVLSDTATVLHIDARFYPRSWIKIAPSTYLCDNNGETYPLRSGIGITPGKEFRMPETGQASFQLVFPPLPDTATSIDFSEGTDETAFCIWGIQLKGKKLPPLDIPSSVAQAPKTALATLPDPVLAYGKATIKGRCFDYRPNMTLPLQCLAYNPMDLAYEPSNLKVDANGAFEYQTNVTGTTVCKLRIAGHTITCFIEPGKETELYINLRELSRRQSHFHQDDKPYGKLVYANGPLAALTEELNTTAARLEYLIPEDKMNLNDLAGYKQSAQQYMNENQNRLRESRLSPAAKEWIDINTRIAQFFVLGMAPNLLTKQAIHAGLINDEQTRSRYIDSLYQVLPENYIDTDLLRLLNTPKALLSPLYPNSMKLFMYLITPSEQADLVRRLGTTQGCFFDLIKAATLYSSINELIPLDNKSLAEAQQLPDAYRTTLLNANANLLKELEAQKNNDSYRVHQLAADVPNDSLFTAILKPFRGKAVLVDFWATWCGPCRMANKQMAPMKEELKDQDIVYLYITGETSPEQTWNNMIPNLHGDHYRLTNAQWQYLGTTLNIHAIPTYYIIDREGQTRFRQAGFPGTQRIKAELLKALQ